ncbi:MAG TPA: hypothetical protein VF277_01645, partial [Steroidobacteraceae bacterium]
GASRLAIEATAGIVDVVERMHSTIQRRPGPLGSPVFHPTRGITGFVYRRVRGTVQLIGRGIDASIAPWLGLLPAGETTAGRDTLLSIVNGVSGDHLVRSANPLAIDMSLRWGGKTIDATNPQASLDAAGGPASTGKLLVLVHGLCMGDLQWNHEGHDHGAALADELGYTPLYLRYNSGLHVSENGRRFAQLLETLVAHWPVALTELTIIGHSMGGLVARSACLHGEAQDHAWRRQLRRLVFLGTPHHGSPLERGGHGLDYAMALSPYSAPLTRLGRQRSAGIQDLRHGTITAGRHRFVPLPADVACHAVAATLGAKRSLLADRLVGDGLVPLYSALGRHADRSRSLAFAKPNRWVGYQMGHVELLRRPEVYAQLRQWLQAPV